MFTAIVTLGDTKPENTSHMREVDCSADIFLIACIQITAEFLNWETLEIT